MVRGGRGSLGPVERSVHLGQGRLGDGQVTQEERDWKAVEAEAGQYHCLWDGKKPAPAVRWDSNVPRWGTVCGAGFRPFARTWTRKPIGNEASGLKYITCPWCLEYIAANPWVEGKP